MYAVNILAFTIAITSCAAAVSQATLAAFKPEPAQWLADDLVASNPDLFDVRFHVTPPGSAQNLVVAAHLPVSLGEISEKGDLEIMRTGKPLVEIQKDGAHIGVELQMLDARKRPIGAIVFLFAKDAIYKRLNILKKCKFIRDNLARDIPSLSALFG